MKWLLKETRMIDSNLKNKLIQDDIWENDPDTFNGVTSSRVDMQDKYLFDDMDGWSEIGNVGTMIGNEIKNLPNRVNAISGLKNVIAGFQPDDKSWTSHDPKNTQEKGFTMLSELKDKKYKNVKMHSKIGLYNSLENLIGLAAGFMVGSMGKSVKANIIDDMTYKFTGGLGIAGFINNLDSVKDNMPTIREIIELNLANFYTMYTAKPGRFVRDRQGIYNYVDPGPLSDLGINGDLYGKYITAEVNPVYRWLNKQASKLDDKEFRYADKFFKLFDYKNYESSEIISSKREDYFNYVNLPTNDHDFVYNKKGRPEKTSLYEVRHFGSIESLEVDYDAENYISQKRDKFAESVYYPQSPNGFKKLKSQDEISEEAKIKVENPRAKADPDSPDSTTNEEETEENYMSEVEDKPIFDFSADDNEKRATIAKLFNRVNETFRKIGSIYVEPYYSDGQLECFEIPFEFNPEISEGGMSAKFETNEVMGRILPLKSYFSSESDQVTINTTYIATNKFDERTGDTEGYSHMKKANWESGNAPDKWLDGWMTDWTTEKLREVEMQYRSLTLPFISKGMFVRPPIVRLVLSAGADKDSDTIEYVGDLFAYPVGSVGKDSGKVEVTRILEGDNGDRLKRYIVTSVKIEPIDNNWCTAFANFGMEPDAKIYGSNVNSGYFRYGFKVSLTLTETTKNFLDITPNYKEYYDAWRGKEEGGSDAILKSEGNLDPQYLRSKTVQQGYAKNPAEDGNVDEEKRRLVNMGYNITSEDYE